MGRDPRTAATSVAARARPTTATASRSRRRARSSTRAGDALGDDPFALEAIEARLRGRGGSVVGCCAVECALHDLVGKLVGQPTWRLLGLADRTPETSYTIGIDSIEGTADRARRAAAGGLPAAQGQARRRGRPRAAARPSARSATCRCASTPTRAGTLERGARAAAGARRARRRADRAAVPGRRARRVPRAARRGRAASRSSSTRAATRCATSPTWPPMPTASTSSWPRPAASARPCAWCTRRARSASSSCSAA